MLIEEEGLPAAAPLWAVRLGEVCERLQRPLEPGERAQLRGEAWRLLTTSLLRMLRAHAGTPASRSRDELEDIASQKALELLLRAESGAWRTHDRPPGEIAGFVSRVARNELVSRWRKTRREVRVPAAADGAWHGETAADSAVAEPHGDPGARYEASQFAAALAQCARTLQPRARLAWFLRVFHELSSREIAAHPSLRMNSAHVNVVLQRARHAVQGCLRSRGFDREGIPAGTFTELWALVHPAPSASSEQTREP